MKNKPVKDSDVSAAGSPRHPCKTSKCAKPGLMELSRVAAADPKSFKVVLCDNTSRLSRDLSLSLDLIKKIKKNQVKVWFENPLADPEPERRLAGKSAMQSKPTRKRAKKRS